MTHLRRPLVALAALVVALGVGYAVDAERAHDSRPPVSATAAAPTVALSALPPQARTTVLLIQRDGPFPYREDGEVFDDREHRLPIEPLGYYHAFTVATPGSADRGERRIVTGAAGQLWYTPDHYVTFRRIDVGD